MRKRVMATMPIQGPSWDPLPIEKRGPKSAKPRPTWEPIFYFMLELFQEGLGRALGAIFKGVENDLNIGGC